jgi:L-phenylalanine/L-methionine N-acetyltransferase
MNPAPLVIRRARMADAEDFCTMMSHPEVYAGLLQMPLPTVELWRKRLADSEEGKDGMLHLVAEREGRVIGSTGLHPALQLRRRHTAMVGISVAVHAQRQGVGFALLQALIDYADNWAQLLRLELTVFTDNTRAISLYRRCGFAHEGTHRAYALRHGQWADVHSMARLHPQPPVLPPASEAESAPRP